MRSKSECRKNDGNRLLTLLMTFEKIFLEPDLDQMVFWASKCLKLNPVKDYKYFKRLSFDVKRPRILISRPSYPQPSIHLNLTIGNLEKFGI